MDGLSLFYEHVLDCIRRIHEEERDNIDKAAHAMADRIQSGRAIHAYGTGVHSYIGAEEMFYRKGGLIPIRPYLDIALSANVGARLATLLEHQPGHADAVLDYYRLGEADVLVIFNAYGFNACAVQSAIRARELKATTIALTAPDYSKQVPADQKGRHPGGKLLYEVADIVIDIKVAPSETVVPLDNLPGKAGGTATLLHAYVINCLAIRVGEIFASRGQIPPIWCVERPEHNQKFLDQFGPQMTHY